MTSITTRMYVVVALLVGVYGVNRWLQIATGPPETEIPSWSLQELPYRIGDWTGTDVELDPKIAVATGAEVVVNRAYRNDLGGTIYVHAAMFRDPAEGIYHSPMNCYPSNGWTKFDEYYEDLQCSEESTVAARLVGWAKGGERVLVAYWYQLGTHVLHNRFDLGGRIRWEMRGQAKWPVLLKVMLWIPLSGREQERGEFRSFAREVATWLNQPEHQKYFAQWDNR